VALSFRVTSARSAFSDRAHSTSEVYIPARLFYSPARSRLVFQKAEVRRRLRLNTPNGRRPHESRREEAAFCDIRRAVFRKRKRRMDPRETTKTSELQLNIRGLEERDFHLWTIGVLVIIILAAGFAALVLPNVMGHHGFLQVNGRYLPQLFAGFIVLIVLFNIYTLQRRRTLQKMRDELVGQLVRREAAEKLSLVDPLTELYNRRYLSQVVVREANRTDRLGSHMTFLAMDVDGFTSLNTRFGHLRGDRVLSEIAQILKRTFRTSDTIVRYGGDEFLALLTDTDTAQAQEAVERLIKQIDRWNKANSAEGFKLSLTCGLAEYSKGNDADAALQAAVQKLDAQKPRLSSPS
jgi:diguanylate cyclase (GGDEF)-like protein